jgi:uncharacterized protein (TIGR03435 family)
VRSFRSGGRNFAAFAVADVHVSPKTTKAGSNGGLTLFGALSKQLALKLEVQKRPMPVPIIDHVEERPTEN